MTLKELDAKMAKILVVLEQTQLEILANSQKAAKIWINRVKKGIKASHNLVLIRTKIID